MEVAGGCGTESLMEILSQTLEKDLLDMGVDRVLLGIGVTPVVVKSTWALRHAPMYGSQEAKNQCRCSNKGKL